MNDSEKGLSVKNEDMLRNVCWHLPELQLYDHVDLDTGEVIGFNSIVLEALLKFYLVDPTISEADIDNEEYLGKKKYIFNVKNNYNRQYFHETFRYMYSRRPRHHPRPTIEPYQRIYMINHPEQLLPFGLREQPWFIMKDYDFKGREHWHPEYKHFDYHNGPYVPKKFRPPKTNKTEYNPGSVQLWKNRGKVVSPPIPEDEA